MFWRAIFQPFKIESRSFPKKSSRTLPNVSLVSNIVLNRYERFLQSRFSSCALSGLLTRPRCATLPNPALTGIAEG
jgi:hypothetical protein